MTALSSEELMERLANGEPITGVLLLGADTFLRDRCRHEIINAYSEEASRDWTVSRYSAETDDLDRVLTQVQSLPMLAKRQVVFWSDVDALERLGDKSRDTLVERFEEYLKNPAPFTILVLEAGSLDERMKLFKVISEKLLVVSCELSGDLPKQLMAAVPLIPGMARDLSVTIDGDAAQFLAETTNADLTRIRTELQKLATFVGERRRITREDVEAIVVSDQRYSVWQLAEILASGDRGRAMVFLESLLREGEQPVAMVGALAWMYRTLIQVQDLPRGATERDVMALRVRFDTAKLALVNAKRIPRAQLTAGLRDLAEADSQLKLGGGATPRARMEFLIARLTTPVLAAAK